MTRGIGATTIGVVFLALLPGACTLIFGDYEVRQGTGVGGGTNSGGTGSTGTGSSGSITTSTTAASSSGVGGGIGGGIVTTGSGGGCSAGTKLCGTACVSTNDVAFGCASASCAPCTNAHGNTTCTAGLCAPTCDPGFADCNGNPNDGCETGVNSDPGDPNNCGTCGHACPPGFNCRSGVCGCAANDAACNAGAPAATFACQSLLGPDVCVCNSGATPCAAGQRCLPDNTCG